MADRKTYLQLLHGEITAAAKPFAENLWEGVNQGITVGIEAHADIAELTGVSEDIPREEVEKLVIPAFRLAIAQRLVQLATEGEYGWHDVFFTNLKQLYDSEGRIDP